jgi:large subunit ribosomal protein L28
MLARHLGFEGVHEAKGEARMPRVCDVTGKKTQMGNQVTRRGKAKAEGGVGKKTTGITRRTFKPNLHRVRIELPDGGLRTLRVAANVIKKGSARISFKGNMITVKLVKATRGRNKRRLEALGFKKP